MKGEVSVKNGMLTVVGEKRRGGAWIAVIRGLDSRYGIAREFIGRKTPVDSGRAVMISVPLAVVEGHIVQVHAGGCAWTHRDDTRAYRVIGGELLPITEADVLEACAAAHPEQTGGKK